MIGLPPSFRGTDHLIETVDLDTFVTSGFPGGSIYLYHHKQKTTYISIVFSDLNWYELLFDCNILTNWILSHSFL